MLRLVLSAGLLSCALGEANVSVGGQVLQRLLVEVDDSLPGFKGGEWTMFREAQTPDAYGCDTREDLLAEELATVSFRRLALSLDATQGSILGSLLGSEAPVPKTLYLMEARVSAANDAMPLLTVGLDRPESLGPMEILEEDLLENQLTVLYDCWRPGTARVELRFFLAAEPSAVAQEACFAWRKTCGDAFPTLQVRHHQSLIYPKSETTPPLLSPEGTLEEVTKLQLAASGGALRLQVPKVTGNEQLKVELRGLTGDTFEVTQTETLELSVVYSCLGTGVMDVELALEQAVLDSKHAPEVLHLHWRKHCGDSVYRFLDIFLKNDMNKTLVVSRGSTLPGFRHCPKMAAQGAVDGTQPLSTKMPCSSEALTVSYKETKSTIELRLDPEGQQMPPVLLPQPDLSFDRKILRAQITQPGEVFRQKPLSAVARATTTSLTVRYNCHKAGVSLIAVTVYVSKHKPIDFAWQKHCKEPKVHTSKALTAPQAMTFAFLVCGGIGLVVCMVCLFCSSDEDKKQLFQGQRPGARAQDHELQPLGSQVGYSREEVVFHS